MCAQYNFFHISVVSYSIKKARMKASIPDFLEQCYKLVDYAKKTLSLARVFY